MSLFHASLEGRVCPLGLGVVVDHLAEGNVVDIPPSSYPHIKLTVDDTKLQTIHKTSQLQLTQNTVELHDNSTCQATSQFVIDLSH